MTRRDTILKWLAYGIALILTVILNYNVLSLLPISLPLLLPLAAVAAGVLEGPRFGAGLGMAAGALLSGAAHAGLLCIPLCALLGWLCGLITLHVLRRDFIGFLVCAAVSLLFWELWQVGSRLIAHTADVRTLLAVAGPEFFWTILLSPVIFLMFRFCCVHYGRIYHA